MQQFNCKIEIIFKKNDNIKSSQDFYYINFSKSSSILLLWTNIALDMTGRK